MGPRLRGRFGLPRPTAILVLAICTGAFLLYAATWPRLPAIDGDSSQYLEVARDLADGRLDALHDRTPGYPILLALTGSTDQPTRTLLVATALLQFVSVWFLCALCHAAGAPRLWVAGICLVLVLPPFVEPAASVMTETLAQAMLAAGLWCLVAGLTQRRLALVAIASLVLAYAALTRPVYQLLPFVLAAGIPVVVRVTGATGLSMPEAGRAAAILVLGSSTVLGGYAWFNQRHFGYFGVTFSTGFHLTTKTINFVERLPEEHAVVRDILVEERNRQVTRRGGLVTSSQTVWHARERLQAATGLSQPELARYLLRLNLLLIRKSPMDYLQEVARSVATYWFPAPTGVTNFGSRPGRWTWNALHVVVVGLCFTQLVILAGASFGSAPVVRATAVQAWTYVLAGSIVFYTMAVSCLLDIGEPRQRRPTDVLLVLMCVLGALMLRQMRRNPGNQA